jgi:multisubunit Na+/H+ antiporter MnhG subunit
MLIIIPILLFSITPILSFILGIIILATDWKNEEINNNKILWGILTLVLLGPIASLIFSIQSINIYKNINDILNDVEKYEKQKTQYDKKSNNDKEDNLENNKDE